MHACTHAHTHTRTHTHTGLFYEHAGNGVYQNMCFEEASKLNVGTGQKTFVRKSPPVTTQTLTQSKASITPKHMGEFNCTYISQTDYCRTSLNCECLLIVNCEFFFRTQ